LSNSSDGGGTAISIGAVLLPSTKPFWIIRRLRTCPILGVCKQVTQICKAKIECPQINFFIERAPKYFF
jgi:hypothetical protein